MEGLRGKISRGHVLNYEEVKLHEQIDFNR